MPSWGVAWTCPSCGADRVIVLVHSLRLLCGACLHQWVAEDHVSLGDLAEAADALTRLLDRRSKTD